MNGPRDIALPPAALQALERYAAELERWNRSINLVSRRDPGLRIQELMMEAVASWKLLVQRWDEIWDHAPPHHWCYLDLGSGGGFPGMVWSLLFERGDWPHAAPEHAHLVEPRLKRVAFLERQVLILSLSRTAVIPHGWPSLPTDKWEPLLSLPAAFVSMKALALPDREVFRPWNRLGEQEQRQVALVRFVKAPDSVGEQRNRLPIPGTHSALHVTRWLGSEG